MKVRYDREDDVLMCELGEDDVDHAELGDGVVVHFSKESKPVLIEALDASEFLAEAAMVAIKEWA